MPALPRHRGARTQLLSDDATPPVSALYELADKMPNGELAYFATHLGDDQFPHIRVARPACPDGDERSRWRTNADTSPRGGPGPTR
jgi:hypothetical protein